jgi:Tc toxin complex TcA C-terminal TcB-binding domain
LKETGRCYLSLPEALFDADYPGQYMRRLRSVSLTIPSVVGPYTSINCTLTLLSNKTRISSNAQGEYRERDDDPRFVTNFAAVQSIATSHAQNDSGLFELSFRDERYLPFEGAGAVSEWRIDLPPECNAFDLDTISDVIIRLNYTAREGGELLRKQAWSAATLPGPHAQPAVDRLGPLPAQPDLTRLYSARHEFPSEWYRFLSPPDSAAAQTLSIALTRERFPFQLRGKDLRIHQVELFLRFKTDEATRAYREEGAPLAVLLTSPAGASANGSLTSAPVLLNGVPRAMIDVGDAGLGSWTLAASDADIGKIAPSLRRTVTVDGAIHQRLNADLVDDLVVVCHYSADNA